MPGTFYVLLPRRRPFSGIDWEALDTTHHESLNNTQFEKKLYIHGLIEFDALLEECLAYTFNALMMFYFDREGTCEGIINSPIFDDVGMMLSRLEKV